jgi:SAM-dependent methyltransferase
MSVSAARAERAPLAHFERLYAESADPWGYETSEYEQRKYRATLAALAERPGRALELACSIGVFTEMLAPRCDSLVAVDFSPTAVEAARRRLAGAALVDVRLATLPEQTPKGPFDAIVCSELLYYWSPAMAVEGLRKIEAALAPGGTLIAVHWRGRDRRRELDGIQVHRILRERCELPRLEVEQDRAYAMDVWRRA